MANAPLWPVRGALYGEGLGEESEVSCAGGSGGVHNDDPDPAEDSRESAGSRGSAPGERQTEQRPPRGRRAVRLVSNFTCKTFRPFVSE